MEIYKPENIKIIVGEREITGFHKEKPIIKCRDENLVESSGNNQTEDKERRMNYKTKADCFTQRLVGLLAPRAEFHAKVNIPLPVNNKTKEYFTFLMSDFADDAVAEGEIDGFVLYGIHELSPLYLSYGVFISGTEYLCSLKENENGKLDSTVKEK